MRVLVTGASGHIGAFVVRRLLDMDAQVCVLARPSSDLWRLRDPLLGDVSGRVGVRRVEVEDTARLDEAFQFERPEALVHLAWEGVTAQKRNDPGQLTRNSIVSLLLLEAAHRSGCQTFVGAGSQTEYGSAGPDAADWNALLRRGQTQGISAYGVSKLGVGLLAQKFCELAGMRGVWLRLVTAYGPQDDARHLIFSVIEQLLDGKKPALTGGEQLWDCLYVTDAAAAICAALQAPGAQGFFDVGSGQAPRLRDLLESLRDLINPALPLGLGDLPYRDDQAMHLQVAVRPFETQTGWAPQVSWETGLQHTLDWQRAQRQKVALGERVSR